MKACKSLLSLAVLLAVSSSVLADNSSVKSNQEGTYNQITATQAGATGSSLNIEQRGDRNRAGPSFSEISQTAKSSSLSITQKGNDNTVYAEQVGDHNTGIVQQSGLATDQLGSIDQSGTSNYSKITQDANGDGSAFILQFSLGEEVRDNSARIIQSNSSNSSTTSIGQFGSHSDAEVSQRNSSNSTAGATQGGTYNKAVVRQDYALNSEGRATQKGNNLSASVTQNNVQNSKLYVDQVGNFSTVDARQQNAHDVKISFRQQGDNSVATSNQSGAYNEADLFQVGNNNRASITQTGQGIGTGADRNQVYVTQMGNGLTATVAQAGGAGNFATITQK
jgi:hypothetical protein